MGGLSMINILEFDRSLKLTWVRKLIVSNPEWLEIAKEYQIDKLLWTGESYHQWMERNCKNPFWKSVINTYKLWYTSMKRKDMIDSNNELIWGNPTLKIPFNKNLYDANIIYIKDLYNDNGIPLTKAQLEEKTGKTVMITTFFAIWKSIPNNQKRLYQGITKCQTVFRPTNIEWLTKEKKGTSGIRKVWSETEEIEIKGKDKWTLELTIDPVLDYEKSWKYFYTLPHQFKLNARAIYFQFQVLHRTLITNRKLTQFGIKDNEQCDNCNEVETITHLLFECFTAQRVWNEVKTWLTAISPNPLYMDKKSILLGNQKNHVIINYVITTVKHEIYKSKWNKSRLNLMKIKKGPRNSHGIGNIHCHSKEQPAKSSR